MKDLQRAIATLRGSNRKWVEQRFGSSSSERSYDLYEYMAVNQILVFRDEKWEKSDPTQICPNVDVSTYNVVITSKGIPIANLSTKNKLDIVAFISKTLDVAPAF